ncbi:MAG TPA: putative glycolipid-binding domain-containing protein, partial [Ktedonobacterales bacterium]|nr:putative glycolipid-binding domain-containing protein [Ktedonobacterales bacterium]
MMEAGRAVRSLLWQQIGGLGLEHCTLSQSASGEWSFAGVVALAMNETPAHVTYTVTCDSAWRTRLVQVRQVLGDAEAGFDAVV